MSANSDTNALKKVACLIVKSIIASVAMGVMLLIVPVGLLYLHFADKNEN